MACDSIADILTRESGRIGPDIYRRNFNRSPWINLVRRGEFPAGMGTQISVLTYERSAPTDAEPAWSTVTVVDGAEGGSCLPAATKVNIASTLRNYDLKRRVLEGPDFCVTDIRFAFQLRDQLEAIIDILGQYTLLEWEIRDRHEYLRLVKWKVTVIAPNLAESTATTAPYFTGGCPNSQLTQGVLDRWYMRLLRDGAQSSALGVEDARPVLTAILSAETSNDLIFRNAEIRQDYRWAQPNKLLAPMGVNRSYKGWYHVIDTYPIRGSCAGGTFTEQAAFETQAATKGNKAEVRSAWSASPFEISFGFDPMVFAQLIPKPITNPATNFRFDPQNYMGDWQLKNILDRVCNPDGTIVYHRGTLAAGSKPIHPERGVAFLHLRCDPSLNLVTTCS